MSDQTTDDSAREREIRSHYGGLIDTSYRLYRQSAVALSVTAISFSTAVLGWSVLKVIPLLGDSAWLGSYMLAFTGAILFGTAPCASCVFSLAYSPFGSKTT